MAETSETSTGARNVTAPLQTYFTTDDVDAIRLSKEQGRRVAVLVVELWKDEYAGEPLEDDPEDAFGDSQGCGCCAGDTQMDVLAARWLV